MKHLIKTILIVFIFVYLLPIGINAQVTSLSISPPLIETIIKPGKSILIAYTITNNGDPVILRPYISSFETKDNGDIIIKEAASPVRFSLDNADLALDQPFFLKGGGHQQILLRMRIPDGAPEGDYYHTLMVESQPPPLIEGISSSRNKMSLGSNILITVTDTGNLNLKGKIVLFNLIPRFKVNFFGRTINIFDSSDKIPLVFTIRNTGRNVFKPEGEINLQGNFGEQAKYELIPVNILTNSQRLIAASPSADVKFNRPVSLVLADFFLGHYQLSANVKLGINTSILSASTDFVALPFRFIIALFFIILIAFLLFQNQKNKK